MGFSRCFHEYYHYVDEVGRNNHFVALFILLFLSEMASFAQTNWATNASGVWHTNINWDPQTVPNSIGGSVLLGPVITTNRLIRLGANTSVGTLTLSSSNNYQVSGFYSMIWSVPGVGTATINVDGGGSPSITAGMLFSDNLLVNQNSTGTFHLGGDSSSSPRSLTKAGTGVLELTGENNFGGGLFINQGTVRAYLETALGNGTNITLNGGTLNWGGDVISDGTRTYTIGTNGGAFNLDGGATFTIGDDGKLLGSGSLTNRGSGTLVLGGNQSSTFTGNLVIESGTVRISAENNLGAAGNDVTFNGGTLSVGGSFTASSGKVFTFSTNGGAIEVDHATTLTLGSAGQLSGSGTFNKNGEGTITITGDNTGFSGLTVVNDGILRITAENNLGNAANDVTLNGGTLNIGGSFTADSGKVITVGANGGTLNMDSGSTLTLANSGNLAGANTLTVSGAGGLAISGNQNAFTGNMVVQGSTVTFSGANGTATGIGNLSITDRGTVLLNNATVNGNRLGANVTLNGGTIGLVAGANVNEELGTLTLSGGGSAVQVERTGGGGSNPIITFSGLNRTGSDATVHFANIGTGGTLGNSGGNNPKISFSTGNAPTLTNSLIGGWATAQANSSGVIEFATIANATNVAALTTFTTGDESGWNSTLNVDPSSDGNAALSGSRSVYSLTLANDRDVDINANTLTIASGGVIGQGAASSIIDGTLTAGSSGVGGNLYFHVVTNGTLTVGATIANNGAGAVGLVKANAGTLLLSGSNTYTGGTYVNQGTLQLGAANRISDSSALTVATGGTFSLNNFNETVASISGGGNISLGSGTLTSGGNNASTTFSGVISGTGGLAKNGTGTLTLSGQNTFNGGLQINNGTISVSEEANLGAAGQTLQMNGGTLQATRSFTTTDRLNMTAQSTVSVDAGQTLTLTSSNQLTGSGNLVKAGTGRLNVGGGSNYTGNLVINGGELRVAGNSADVNAFLTSNRLANVSGSGGTLMLAYSNSITNTISSHPSSPSNVKLGFDVSGTASNITYLIGPTNYNLNWAGLVVNGGDVELVEDHALVGTSATTLEINDGTLHLAGRAAGGGKSIEVTGDVALNGGAIHGGPGGGPRGSIITHGNLASSGTVLLSGPSITMVAASNVVTVLGGTTPLNGITDLTKQGAGTVRVDQRATATNLRIEDGTLLLGASERFNDDVNVIINGGTFATGGFTENVGTLTLENNSTLDLGAGNNSVLAFHDSSGQDWGSFELTITNYFDSTERIYFGTTSGGLTTNQLSKIVWVDPYGSGSGLYYGAIIKPDGRIRPMPIPEARSVAAVMVILGLIIWRERKYVKMALGLLKRNFGLFRTK